MADDLSRLVVWGAGSALLCAVLHAIYRLFSDKRQTSQSISVSSGKPAPEKEATGYAPTDASSETRPKKKRQWKANKTEYQHPWLVKSLKGHPGAVLDVDFSGNGKYLASTCEDAAGTPPPPPTSSPSLSRRRKPRGRLRPSPTPPAPPPPRMPADELAAALRSHLLSPERMWALGYPLEFEPNSCKAVLYASPPPRVRVATYFDVNAPEFVPAGSGSPDSGRGSGGSSPNTDSDEEADPAAVEHVCVRCDSVFRVGGDGEYITRERCLYHWGRPAGGVLACCGGSPGSRGCTVARLHVWNGTRPGMNGPLDGYVRARARRGGVYSLDTEMCYTTAGLELASVAVVGADGRLVYRATVRPRAPVIDYNTRFSGIRQRDLERATKTLRDVQNDILGFVGSDTVLVGHALDNDLRALKLLHAAVVDTCALYPHARGFPLRRSLRALSAELLGRAVQDGPHSPLEDARAALDLVLLHAHADRVSGS